MEKSRLLGASDREPQGLQDCKVEDLSEPQDYNRALLELLASPNIAGKTWFYHKMREQVPETVLAFPGAASGGTIVPETEKGIAMSTGGNRRYCCLDPYRGGIASVAEAARKLVCAGARPLGLTAGLFVAQPNREDWRQLEQVVDGMLTACRALGIPVISGKVSVSRESRDQDASTVPLVGMVGFLEEAGKYLTPGLKQAGDLIVLLGETHLELGGSEYLAAIHGVVAGMPPEVDLEREKRVQELCLAAHKAGILDSAHDCAQGGLLVAVVESCLTAEPDPLGAEIEVTEVLRPDFIFFGESQSRIVVSLPQEKFPVLQDLAVKHGVRLQILGRVIQEKRLRVGSSSQTTRYRELINLDLGQVQEKWKSLEKAFGTGN